MLTKTYLAVVTLLLLFGLPLFATTVYKLVVKENGKVIEGQLASEDDSAITIISGGARLTYRKSELDLEKMKELNSSYTEKAQPKTVPMPDKSGVKERKKNETQLADVAKKKTDGQATAPTAVDTNEKALSTWVQELDDRSKINPSMQTQMQLSKARKALSHYRARNERQFSETDRRLMLEQLVNALEFLYTKELEAGAPDDKTAPLKKKIEDTKQELAALD